MNKKSRANILNAFPLRLGARQGVCSHHFYSALFWIYFTVQYGNKEKRCKYFWERNEILPFYNLESFCYCFEYVCLVFNPDSQIIWGLDLLCLSFIITILSPSASIIFTSLFILFLFIWLFSSLSSIFIIIKFLVKSSTCNLLFVRSFCHFLFCL